MNWDRVWDDGRMLINGDRDNFLSVRLYYTRGGDLGVIRGYYLSVTPVRRDVKDGYALLSCCPSDGKKVLIKAVNRKSARADAIASRIASDVLSDVVAAVCDRNGIDPLSVGALLN